MLHLYGICGSRNSRRFGRRATSVKNGNAGPKLHLGLWGKSVFSALPYARGYVPKIEILFDFLGPKLNFFSLTVCKSEHFLKNGSEKTVLLP